MSQITHEFLLSEMNTITAVQQQKMEINKLKHAKTDTI